MECQNITLSIPRDILKRVKHLAVERNTSVSGLLSGYLREMVTRDDAYHKAKASQMEMMAQGFYLTDQNKLPWTKEDLHDRR